jgi:hypothetical protein
MMQPDAARPAATREPVLNPLDRVSELLFGLFMALTFVGAVSVTEAGRNDIRVMLGAALGCNLAWGLVDAVMYLVRTVADRGRLLSLSHAVRAAASEPAEGRRVIERALQKVAATLLTSTEVEAVRQRIVAMDELPLRPRITRDDVVAAFAVFLIVVASTFPVVLPFVLFGDVGVAKAVSRAIALAMLFLGGLAIGRYAGYGSWKAGVLMAGLGSVVVAAVMALGG